MTKYLKEDNQIIHKRLSRMFGHDWLLLKYPLITTKHAAKSFYKKPRSLRDANPGADQTTAAHI